jgi:uncharacterized protein (DUF427 family)
MMRDEMGFGQESVWDYPRPPRLERSARRVRVELDGTVIADSTSALRVLETSHPPTYYVPPDDVVWDLLTRASGDSWCEWKGRAGYWTVETATARVERGAWSYRAPRPPYEDLVDHVAFYPAQFRCHLDDELVTPQPGGFYGGWVTSDVVGPFKGGPGTMGW